MVSQKQHLQGEACRSEAYIGVLRRLNAGAYDEICQSTLTTCYWIFVCQRLVKWGGRKYRDILDYWAPTDYMRLVYSISSLACSVACHTSVERRSLSELIGP
jgi:hypothetical protein